MLICLICKWTSSVSLEYNHTNDGALFEISEIKEICAHPLLKIAAIIEYNEKI